MLSTVRLLQYGLTLLVLGCSPGSADPDDSWLGTIDTVGGVIHVRNPEAGIWTQGRRWRIVEDLRIGSIEGVGPEVFGRVAAVGVSPSGDLYVLDEQSQDIRVFDSTGRYQRTIGRKGAGPGEFQQAYGLSWDHAGRLWVTDPGNGRYAVFDSAGHVLSHPPRSVPGVLFPWLGGFGKDGLLYDVVPVAQADGSTAFTYFRVDTLGQVIDSLPALVQRARPAPPTMGLMALMPRLTFRFHPSGYRWVGETGEYRLAQLDWNGDTLRVVEREYTSLRVTQQERDSLLAEVNELPPMLRVESPEIPPRKAVFERIHLDPDGYVYLQLVGRPEDQGKLFDVLDPEGRYLGNIVSDIQFTTYRAPPVFTADYVYGVTTDSLGVDYVVRARIERPE